MFCSAVATNRDKDNRLREFVSANERHPESVRTVPWLCPAGCDSAPRIAGDRRLRVPNPSYPLLK